MAHVTLKTVGPYTGHDIHSTAQWTTYTVQESRAVAGNPRDAAVIFDQ